MSRKSKTEKKLQRELADARRALVMLSQQRDTGPQQTPAEERREKAAVQAQTAAITARLDAHLATQSRRVNEFVTGQIDALRATASESRMTSGTPGEEAGDAMRGDDRATVLGQLPQRDERGRFISGEAALIQDVKETSMRDWAAKRKQLGIKDRYGMDNL